MVNGIPHGAAGGAGAPTGAGGPNILDAIVAKLASLFGGGNMGPGIIPQHTNALNAANNVDTMNPQGTPMPTPLPTPTALPTPAAGIPKLSTGPHTSPLSTPHLADANKRMGGTELSGHREGVLGEGKGFTAEAGGKLRQKNPFAVAKAPTKSKAVKV